MIKKAMVVIACGVMLLTVQSAKAWSQVGAAVNESLSMADWYDQKAEAEARAISQYEKIREALVREKDSDGLKEYAKWVDEMEQVYKSIIDRAQAEKMRYERLKHRHLNQLQVLRAIAASA
ncbi:MAG: hypothetical protein Q8R76_09845 [Candidatus Omnitrophota bacterium]|nr:hypothetical protein [Candidatus Omnitrophota bacterium]